MAAALQTAAPTSVQSPGAKQAAADAEDIRVMRDAIEEAKKALSRREVPVGCIIVDETGAVVCKKRNRPNETYNATAHAEMLAVDEMVRGSASREAARQLFARCTLYVTVEPCVMCAAALARVGMGRVVFGASNDKFGGCGTAVDVASGRHCPGSARHHGLACTGGLLQDEAVDLLRQFYSRGNVRAPRPQRPVPPEWRAASLARAPPRNKGRPAKRSRTPGDDPDPAASPEVAATPAAAPATAAAAEQTPSPVDGALEAEAEAAPAPSPLAADVASGGEVATKRQRRAAT
ncbi:hypothetical protein FNF27_06167 [Cafeteria roenbergensis]|uniref:CMP/dCMP-type deaminase domain-containing protein n=2 Tax=Cafeteria roenbergensis TaxID=33653 RepID=A0A5A8D441_CAFRO|nr:hypothetical protein FNF29_00314 [Cafeteria roenbergensis]KAA0159217.1 hypothetical protein FNF31_04945 [Cafeteria roenbergensis]KAA0159564.1 hypothetical protein FNF28_05816 [Cafeteria roenbergensis]KAA0171896.1 hypothetical protein FNF27_06167 [Cafeteria roenbergensis]|eukprot:KAA0157740.1 hypothetical protein FNF29_00314 [Cafeteria roenbergensis]